MDAQSEMETPNSQTAPESPKGEEAPSIFSECQNSLQKLEKAEEKIALCLEFMRKALTGSRHPRLRDFWEIKKICLPLFKEAISPSARSHLWSAYVEISGEAKQLKDLLEEQSAFAVEQIELALKALENDLENFAPLLEKMPDVAGLEFCRSLHKKKAHYNTLQRELHLLGTFAARVNGLRKEVIKIEMRMRHKNQFFDRLSKAGDRVFPRRKELIKQISQEFFSDVEAFTKENFSQLAGQKTSLPGLREEIKALQSCAKQITLDTRSFNETRLLLSKCWDQLKEMEKEKKKEFAEKRESYQKNVDLVMGKIKMLAEKCAAPECTLEEASKVSTEIMNFMKTIDLGRDEVRMLRDEVDKAKSPVTDRLRKEQEEKEKALQESARQRREKLDQLKAAVEQAIAQIDSAPLEEAAKTREALAKEADLLGLSHAEKEIVHHLLKKLRDAIIDKREKAIADLPADKRESLDHLKGVLAERKLQRQEIKAELETYRKALASSGFDFEKAMRYRELLDAEKIRLDKVGAAIEEIEQKIVALEG